MMEGMVVRDMAFKVGQTLTIFGVPKPDATNFAINIGQKEDFTLHINPRFNAHGDENKVVCNSYQEGKWGEEFRPEGFPFQQGKEFKIMINFTTEEFAVTLPDGSVFNFPNRIGTQKYSVMSFCGDVRIIGIEIR